MSTPTIESNENQSTPMDPHRKRVLLTIAAVFLLIAVVYGAYWLLVARYQLETDNAYAAGNVVQITPLTAGTVVAINADDTDFVKVGQVLMTLDKSDATVALNQAEAQLAQAVREVRNTFAGNKALGASVEARQADVARAKSQLDNAQAEVSRRSSLVASGAVSKEELQNMQTALDAAKAGYAAAGAGLNESQEQLKRNQTLTEGTSVENHPRVQTAAAQLRTAYLNFKRSNVTAPVSGYVAKRSAQLGQRVQIGAPVMAIIPLDQVWVDANYKESQLRDVRIGQPVTLTADIYGSKVEYHGKVAGLSAGTGAAFALLPAQNATGNWIKVVQRLPVRINLDAKELAANPLRIGVSMAATIDTHDTSGKSITETVRSQPVATTGLFDNQAKEAEEHVKAIISANLGH